MRRSRRALVAGAVAHARPQLVCAVGKVDVVDAGDQTVGAHGCLQLLPLAPSNRAASRPLRSQSRARVRDRQLELQRIVVVRSPEGGVRRHVVEAQPDRSAGVGRLRVAGGVLEPDAKAVLAGRGHAEVVEAAVVPRCAGALRASARGSGSAERVVGSRDGRALLAARRPSHREVVRLAPTLASLDARQSREAAECCRPGSCGRPARRCRPRRPSRP